MFEVVEWYTSFAKLTLIPSDKFNSEMGFFSGSKESHLICYCTCKGSSQFPCVARAITAQYVILIETPFGLLLGCLLQNDGAL